MQANKLKTIESYLRERDYECNFGQVKKPRRKRLTIPQELELEQDYQSNKMVCFEQIMKD